MARAAKDEADYQRTRARVYAPPEAFAAGRRRRPAGAPASPAGAASSGGPTPGGGMTRSQALAMMAEIAAEDARLSSRPGTGEADRAAGSGPGNLTQCEVAPVVDGIVGSARIRVELDTLVHASADELVGEVAEPALNLVDPRGAGRSEMHVEAGIAEPVHAPISGSPLRTVLDTPQPAPYGFSWRISGG